MIARRFRALGWVVGISTAATGLYLISLQVAAERAKLQEVDRQINAAHHQMWQLQTELGTRANMRQLERWNDDVLALAAPRASQYLHGEAELASLSTETMTAAAATTATATVADTPHAVLVAATPQPGRGDGIASRLVKVLSVPAASGAHASALQRVSYFAPASGGDRAALAQHAVIDGHTLRDIMQSAAVERHTQP